MKGSALPVLLMLLLSSCAQDDYAGEVRFLGVGAGQYSPEEQLEAQVQFVRQAHVDEEPDIPEVHNLGLVNVIQEGKKAQFRVSVRLERVDPKTRLTKYGKYRDDDFKALRYLRGHFDAVDSRAKTAGQIRYHMVACRQDGKDDPFVDGFNDGIEAAKALEQSNW